MEREKAIEWIRDFLKRIDSQDNRATAAPILFLLQRKVKYVAHPEYHHHTETIFHHPEMESLEFSRREDAEKWLAEYGYEGERLAEEISNIEEFEMGHHWETDQAFFTAEGVKRHIEINGHNLREHRDYVVHCFRNPEMRELFAALRAVSEAKP